MLNTKSLGNEIDNFRSQLDYELNKNHTALSQKTTNLPVASSIENLEVLLISNSVLF